MTCDSVSKLIPLYFYGELPAEEEERVEDHLHECASCARELEKQRSLAVALDGRRMETPPLLAEECRMNLMAAVRAEARRPMESARPQPSSWKLFERAMGGTFAGLGRLRQPLGALALLAVGFLAARVTGITPEARQASPSNPSDRIFATVRSVQPEPSGAVQIAFDETRRRVVSGRMDDENIQRLLLAAAREDNPAVRVESVDVLKSRADSGEVRDALLNAVAHDPNPGVRLKALEGLKPQAEDESVRKTLAHVLLTDDNPAVRMEVVDLLVARPDDSMVGILQNLVQKENNNYVRQKCEKALKDMNASVGTF
ncbi:MAG TPA: HEAT repeat domain-containing protein [Bryobacteraceae bacterium]|nr:HEAT repeat domain-containing protein [Bryobacteraceae bacterium]